jgi:hypothetical protein
LRKACLTKPWPPACCTNFSAATAGDQPWSAGLLCPSLQAHPAVTPAQ